MTSKTWIGILPIALYLTALLIVVKAMNLIHWPWIWVVSPLWIGCGLWIVIVVINMAVLAAFEVSTRSIRKVYA